MLFRSEMLVMPLGPSASSQPHSPSYGNPNARAGPAPPSSWNVGAGPHVPKYKPRHRNTDSNDSRELRPSHSVYTAAPSTTSNGFGTVGRSRSMISIEKGGAARKGSISVGRGTSKKGSASGVEALGITASGFFAPPASAPPVPSFPGR